MSGCNAARKVRICSIKSAMNNLTMPKASSKLTSASKDTRCWSSNFTETPPIGSLKVTKVHSNESLGDTTIEGAEFSDKMLEHREASMPQPIEPDFEKNLLKLIKQSSAESTEKEESVEETDADGPVE